MLGGERDNDHGDLSGKGTFSMYTEIVTEHDCFGESRHFRIVIATIIS